MRKNNMINPSLLDLPMPIRTKRLEIRPMIPEDDQQIFALIEESRKDFEKGVYWTTKIKNLEDSSEIARTFYAGYLARKIFSFVFFSDQRLIGGLSYNRPNWNTPSAAIGYYVRSSEHNKGFAREAVAALTLYGFKQIAFKRINILCDEENIRSIRVAESLGFTLELRKKGIIKTPKGRDLRLERQYARHDISGLEEWEAAW